MSSFLKSRWPLLVVLVLFTACKIPHLYYQFFWDESWVYAPAARLMHLHGPSLMPNAIDVAYSRGHPLMFPAAYAAWMRIFGTSHFAMHSLSLIISLALIITIYETTLKLFNQRVAAISILLLSLHIGFFVNSAFVLPDMMISLLILLSLYHYATGRYLLTALWLTALFYTKESGMVLGVVLGINAFISLFNKDLAIRTRIWRCAAVAIPVAAIGVFFLIQKQVMGWYMYPDHIGLINWDPGHAFYWSRRAIEIIFINDRRGYFFLPVLLLAMLAAARQHSGRPLLLLLPAVAVYYLGIQWSYTEFVYILLITVLLGSMIGMPYLLDRHRYFKDERSRRYLLLSIAFFIAYLYFSCINFFEGRYLFPIIILSLIMIAICYDRLLSISYPVSFYPVLIIIAATGLYLFATDDHTSDLGAFDAMDIHQDIVDRFEKNRLYDKVITGPFLDIVHLQDPYTGYLSSGKTFGKARFSHIHDTAADYEIINSLELDVSYEQVKKDTGYVLVSRFEKGSKWAELYARKH